MLRFCITNDDSVVPTESADCGKQDVTRLEQEGQVRHQKWPVSGTDRGNQTAEMEDAEGPKVPCFREFYVRRSFLTLRADG